MRVCPGSASSNWRFYLVAGGRLNGLDSDGELVRPPVAYILDLHLDVALAVRQRHVDQPDFKSVFSSSARATMLVGLAARRKRTTAMARSLMTGTMSAPSQWPAHSAVEGIDHTGTQPATSGRSTAPGILAAVDELMTSALRGRMDLGTTASVTSAGRKLLFQLRQADAIQAPRTHPRSLQMVPDGQHPARPHAVVPVGQSSTAGTRNDGS